ncbi:hypothetical protein TRIUR3_17535 [Triticum urartu]|uniref:Uncharacterized protein n=1 Tax=Triticum urartu TaxID=4572 RepID=M7Z408_TRIUA|nr:hypothetical protein TRIUR3_17535 [Triticum urartu]
MGRQLKTSYTKLATIQQSGDPVVPPAPTSRMSVEYAIEVIQTFDEFKRFFVTSIGFGGMLQPQMLQKLNLKFSAWTMSKVSTTRCAIVLAENTIVKFWAEDVHKIFGIPCGHHNIKGRDGGIKPEAIKFIKSTLGMQTKRHLVPPKVFLMRDISESSIKLEKDCFQIAFIIFVMGHVLVPTTKHDYATIDFLGAPANTDDKPVQLVRLKNDILSNNPATNLFGCHLFLQIFLLDNLDLGMFNKPHTVLPRVSVFYQDSLCGMTNMATDVGKGGYFLCFRTVTPPVNCLLCPFQALCRLAVRVKKHRKITGLAITFMRWQYFFEQADRTVHTAHQTNVPQMDTALQHILHTMTLFAKENLQAISELYIDLPNDASTTDFGQRHLELPCWKHIYRPGFQTNPWGRGVVPYPPQAGVAQLLEQFFISAPDNELSCGNGKPLFKLEYPIEPDFSTLVLSDSDFLHTLSIEKQLSADSLKYDITSSQMKILNVIDPLYAKISTKHPYKECDEALAWKLHSALFACLHEFYAGWPAVKENWRIKHDPTTDDILTATMHCREFDGYSPWFAVVTPATAVALGPAEAVPSGSLAPYMATTCSRHSAPFRIGERPVHGTEESRRRESETQVKHHANWRTNFI